ncbi:MAG: SUMF1/EgtB/PvdO family nonheme iron enzyme [Candidatus Omnitrophota bacterium]
MTDRKCVFISHSKHDEHVADTLCSELEKKGFTCWIAKRDIQGGEDFAEAIVAGINRSGVLLLVFSENANKSKHVLREVKLADDRDIPIIPVRIEKVTPVDTLDYYIGINQWIDAYDKSPDAYLPTVVSAISAHINPGWLSVVTHPLEYHTEYILIPGGTYIYSLTKKHVTVPTAYFSKYPVTNKRYNRFISYLEGRENDLLTTLPFAAFAETLLAFSHSIQGFEEYLGSNPTGWAGKLRSKYDDEVFNREDHPVIGVTWFDARAYCFWLSCMEAMNPAGAAGKENRVLPDAVTLSGIYRLPDEKEWEWAAGGEPDGSIREYPWPREKGGPSPQLANYGGNVGSTTPVNRYPDGATPSGLMDMGGNILEWMENPYDNERKYPAVRGGSWDGGGIYLRCAARDKYGPMFWDNLFGFRTMRPVNRN